MERSKTTYIIKYKNLYNTTHAQYTVFFLKKNQLLLFLHIPEFFNCLSSDEYFSLHLNLRPKHAAQNSPFSAKHISQ